MSESALDDKDYGATWRLHVKDVVVEVLVNRDLTATEIAKLHQALKDSWDLLIERKSNEQGSAIKAIIEGEIKKFNSTMSLSANMKTEVGVIVQKQIETHAEKNFKHKNNSVSMIVSVVAVIISLLMLITTIRSNDESTRHNIELFKKLETLLKAPQ